MVKIGIDQQLCNGCGTCVDKCPMNVFAMKDEKARAERSDDCMSCLLCEVECEQAAIKVNEI